MRSESGYTVLELTLSLLLSSGVLVVLSSLLVNSLTLLTKTEKEVKQIRREITLINLMSDVIRDLDTHTLALYPRIHKGGDILSLRGSENRVLNGKHRPKRGSDALTYVSLPSTKPFHIKNLDHNKKELCLAKPLIGLDKGSALLIGIDGTTEVSLTTALSSHCFAFSIEEDSFIAYDPESVRSSSLLLPIRLIYTLYLSERSTLRLLSHRGKYNRENQPVLYGLDSLKLTQKVRPLFGESARTLSVHATHITGQAFTFTLINTLLRDNSWNYILNQLR